MGFKTAKLTSPTRTSDFDFTPSVGPEVSSVSGNNALDTLTINFVDGYASPISGVTAGGIAQADITEIDANSISVTLRNTGAIFGSNVDLIVTDANGASNAFSFLYNAPAGFAFDVLANTIPELTSQLVEDGDVRAYQTQVTSGGETHTITGNADGSVSSDTAVEGTPVPIFTQDANGSPNYALSNIANMSLGTNEAPAIINGGIPDQVFDVGDIVSVDLSQYASDSDINDSLGYTMVPANAGGLTLDFNTGILSGTATELAATSITVAYRDRFDQTVIDAFDLTVNALVTPTPTPAPTPSPTPTPTPTPTPQVVSIDGDNAISPGQTVSISTTGIDMADIEQISLSNGAEEYVIPVTGNGSVTVPEFVPAGTYTLILRDIA